MAAIFSNLGRRRSAVHLPHSNAIRLRASLLTPHPLNPLRPNPWGGGRSATAKQAIRKCHASQECQPCSEELTEEPATPPLEGQARDSLLQGNGTVFIGAAYT